MPGPVEVRAALLRGRERLIPPFVHPVGHPVHLHPLFGDRGVVAGGHPSAQHREDAEIIAGQNQHLSAPETRRPQLVGAGGAPGVNGHVGRVDPAGRVAVDGDGAAEVPQVAHHVHRVVVLADSALRQKGLAPVLEADRHQHLPAVRMGESHGVAHLVGDEVEPLRPQVQARLGVQPVRADRPQRGGAGRHQNRGAPEHPQAVVLVGHDQAAVARSAAGGGFGGGFVGAPEHVGAGHRAGVAESGAVAAVGQPAEVRGEPVVEQRQDDAGVQSHVPGRGVAEPHVPSLIGQAVLAVGREIGDQAQRVGQVGVEPAQPRRPGPLEAIAVVLELDEVGEPAQLGGQRPGQLVLIEAHLSQVGEPAQLGRDRTRQAVAAEVQDDEIAQPAQLGRNGTRQAVGAEVQAEQLGQLAQPGRDGPVQTAG